MFLTCQGTLASCLRQEETRDKRVPVAATGSVHWQASWPLSTPSGRDVSLSEEESPPESPFVAGRWAPSRAQKWALVGNELSEETHVLTKQEILLGKGTWVGSSRVREPRRTALPQLTTSGFMVMGLVSGLSLANHSDSESFLVVHTLFSQDGCQREGFWEVVRHVVSPFDLS